MEMKDICITNTPDFLLYIIRKSMRFILSVIMFISTVKQKKALAFKQYKIGT